MLILTVAVFAGGGRGFGGSGAGTADKDIAGALQPLTIFRKRNVIPLLTLHYLVLV